MNDSAGVPGNPSFISLGRHLQRYQLNLLLGTFVMINVGGFFLFYLFFSFKNESSANVSLCCFSAVTCKVEVSKMKVASLRIKKLRPTSDCEMKMNSVQKEEITVTSTADLSFQDCLPEDIKVTTRGAIGESRC